MDYEKLVEEIRRVVRLEMVRSESPWLDVAGAAAYTNHAVSTIYSYVSRKKIPHYKGPVFKKSELDKWMEENPVPVESGAVKAIGGVAIRF